MLDLFLCYHANGLYFVIIVAKVTCSIWKRVRPVCVRMCVCSPFCLFHYFSISQSHTPIHLMHSHTQTKARSYVPCSVSSANVRSRSMWSIKSCNALGTVWGEMNEEIRATLNNSTAIRLIRERTDTLSL